MPTTDLTPGTVTTLGQLRPGDVGEWCGFGEGAPKFVVLKHMAYPGFGVCVDAAYDGGGGISEPFLSRPVRYLGRGRIEPAKIVLEGEIEPAKIVLEGESDPTIEQTVLRVLAAAVSDGIVTYDRDPTRLTAGELVGAANVLNDAMGEQQRRVAELEEQVRTLREAMVQAAIPLEAINGSVQWELCKPLQDSVSAAVKIVRSTLTATAPKETP